MNKKFFLNEIEKETDFNPDYSQIKDSVIAEQYLKQGKKSKLKIRFFSLLATVAVILCAVIIPFSLNKSNAPTVEPNKKIYNSDKEFLDEFEFVFIAKIVKKTDVKEYDGTGSPVVYVYYELEVEKFLKGEGKKTEILCCYDYEESSTGVEFPDSELPDIGECYLFIANRKSGSNNNRIEEGVFVVGLKENMIRLANYRMGSELSEQTEEIQQTVQRYQNIIDKNTGYLATFPEFNDDKELADYFDYMFIAEIANSEISNGTGAGSEIVSAFYRINIIDYLKNDTPQYNGRISILGADFWGCGGVALPSTGNFYLVFANKKSDNCGNDRLKKDDFVILHDSQMILLEGYNINENYTKQNDTIIEILNRYISVIK